jgi:hypothetical protein
MKKQQKKNANPQNKARKLKLNKNTIKDLDPKSEVKGGLIADTKSPGCVTRAGATCRIC